MRIKKVLPVLVLLLAAGAVVFVVSQNVPRVTLAERVLPLVAEALEQYTNQSHGGTYPIAASAPTPFFLDIEAIQEIAGFDFSEESRQLVADYLSGKCGVDVCYTGYFLVDNDDGVALVHAIEDLGVERALCDTINLSEYGSFWEYGWSGERIASKAGFRLKDGIERFLITDIGNPAGSAVAKSQLPVLWEMPDINSPSGGWVLYAGGNVAWLPYPSKFPYTHGFITGIRRVMGERSSRLTDDQSRERSKPPRWSERGKPQEIALPPELSDCRALEIVEIRHCDPEPKLRVGEQRGFLLQLAEGDLALFDEASVADLDVPAALWPDYVIIDGVWQAPLRHPPDPTLNPYMPTHIHFHFLPVAHFMGATCGFRWYGNLPLATADVLRERLGLVGGDDRLELIRHTEAVEMAPLLGAAAIPFLTEVATGPSAATRGARALVALEAIGGPEAEAVVKSVLSSSGPSIVPVAVGIVEAADDGNSWQRTLSPVYWRGPSDTLLNLAIEALLREDEPERLVSRAACWAMLPRQVMGPGFRRTIAAGEQILRELPPELVCRPLDEILDPSELSPLQRLDFDERRSSAYWDSIRATYCSQDVSAEGDTLQ